jgi:hypothetical protein
VRDLLEIRPELPVAGNRRQEEPVARRLTELHVPPGRVETAFDLQAASIEVGASGPNHPN